MVGAATKEYIAAMLRPPGEVICWTGCKIFGKYDSFTQPNTKIVPG